MKFRIFITGLSTVFCLLMIESSFASSVKISGGVVQVSPNGHATNMTLTITGPNGFQATSYSEFSVPKVSISRNSIVSDGLYRWQLTGASGDEVAMQNTNLDYGRGDNTKRFIQIPMGDSGVFRVKNGQVISPQLKRNNVSGSDADIQ